jgi:hypothetical protein
MLKLQRKRRERERERGKKEEKREERERNKDAKLGLTGLLKSLIYRISVPLVRYINVVGEV